MIGVDLAMSKPSCVNLKFLREVDTLQSSFLCLPRVTKLEDGLRTGLYLPLFILVSQEDLGGGESGGFSYRFTLRLRRRCLGYSFPFTVRKA